MQAIERKSRRYLDDQGGFACLEARLKGYGRRRCSHTQQCRRQSRGLSGGKQGEETINTRQTMQHKCMTWQYEVLGVT